MNQKLKNKLVIVVRNGIVDSVYCSKEDLISETEIIDLDSTEPNVLRKSKLHEKTAKKSMKQIY